ncbi:MAG: hypothetical protein D5R98_08945 [Desulfonatronovibrio sp. MSAO_Bac4]|nr:MAG: hypothetical protein D5R98_08945 [Desulfonatronovibrio sp. MSAO_Bac4]
MQFTCVNRRKNHERFIIFSLPEIILNYTFSAMLKVYNISMIVNISNMAEKSSNCCIIPALNLVGHDDNESNQYKLT